MSAGAMHAGPIHRVETLTWELRHANPQAALHGHEFQQRLWRFLKDEGLTCIAKHFDRLDEKLGTPQRVVSLDRLELDLGTLHPSQGEQAWRARLSSAIESALEAVLHAPQSHTTRLDQSASTHEVDQFITYLDLGHLPWSLPTLPHGSLALWLDTLIRRHGRRLWQELEHHPERVRLMQRLQRIHGLHALLAYRNPFVAQALEHLDDIALGPLQAQGHLSAYARDKLRQTLRSQALDMLWNSRGQQLGETRRRQLLQALQAVLTQALGHDWQDRLRPLWVRRVADQNGVAELVHALVQPLEPHEAPSPAWESEVARWQPWVHRGRSLAPEEQQALLQHLQHLRQSHPEVLRERLRQWMAAPDQRRRWALSLDPATFGEVLGLLQPAALAVHWAESLRQTALRLQRMAPPQARPGVSRLQRLLMEACLQALAQGEALPDTHAGWQRFWENAWLRWQPRQHPPEPSPRQPTQPRPPLTKATAVKPEGSLLDRTLRSLARQCEQGRWQWSQRLRMARLLSQESTCKRWMQLFSESKRWQMIKAQFGAVAPALEQRASRLQQWLGQRLGQHVREPAAVVAEHWRRLCSFLFVRGKSPDTAALRQDYQAQGATTKSTTDAAPARSAHKDAAAPIWVDDAGQVLIAVYAERLFKHLGLIEGGRFRSPDAQAQGVQCLQALCHGERDECHTVLSRLLCGVAPAVVLPQPEPLSNNTLGMLEQLLQAVIGHWKALGNTSVAGLRESFLCRQGRLQREPVRHDAPPAWRLVVEKRGFDVLLDRLPWSYNTIRLPWMEGVLHVEWR